ncbi:Uncharacterised protein [Mycobacteroides abscessus subsp. massiliense]|nr:Uncharacterised protein [Mycobacteroides abscessus subsp. massiliense]SLI87991.1 Uncharacterised protein [Mycobacteroides abscessus subsp. massiliense]
MVIASRWTEKPLTSTGAHARKCHNRRSEPFPLKLSRRGAFLTPGGSRQVFLSGARDDSSRETGKDHR